MAHVGKNIKTLRELKRITQTDLATSVGVAPPYLSQIETMLRMPSLGVLQRIAQTLDTSVEILLGKEPAAAASTERLDPRERVRLLKRLVEEMEREVEERAARRQTGEE